MMAEQLSLFCKMLAVEMLSNESGNQRRFLEALRTAIGLKTRSILIAQQDVDPGMQGGLASVCLHVLHKSTLMHFCKQKLIDGHLCTLLNTGFHEQR